MHTGECINNLLGKSPSLGTPFLARLVMRSRMNWLVNKALIMFNHHQTKSNAVIVVFFLINVYQLTKFFGWNYRIYHSYSSCPTFNEELWCVGILNIGESIGKNINEMFEILWMKHYMFATFWALWRDCWTVKLAGYQSASLEKKDIWLWFYLS